MKSTVLISFISFFFSCVLSDDCGSPNVYASEAVDQIVALCTDPAHKHKTVVILAGYQVTK